MLLCYVVSANPEKIISSDIRKVNENRATESEPICVISTQKCIKFLKNCKKMQKKSSDRLRHTEKYLICH